MKARRQVGSAYATSEQAGEAVARPSELAGPVSAPRPNCSTSSACLQISLKAALNSDHRKFNADRRQALIPRVAPA